MRGKKAKALRRAAREQRALIEDTVLNPSEEALQVAVLGMRRVGRDGIQKIQAFYPPDTERAIYQDLKKNA